MHRKGTETVRRCINEVSAKIGHMHEEVPNTSKVSPIVQFWTKSISTSPFPYPLFSKRVSKDQPDSFVINDTQRDYGKKS